LILCVATSLVLCNSAFADPAAVVKAHSDAFGTAFSSCNVPGTLKLYEDNAVMIWPFEGEVATGKTEIEKPDQEGMFGRHGRITRAGKLRFTCDRKGLYHQCRNAGRYDEGSRWQTKSHAHKNHLVVASLGWQVALCERQCFDRSAPSCEALNRAPAPIR
jgi:hypothetical protein